MPAIRGSRPASSTSPTPIRIPIRRCYARRSRPTPRAMRRPRWQTRWRPRSGAACSGCARKAPAWSRCRSTAPAAGCWRPRARSRQDSIGKDAGPMFCCRRSLATSRDAAERCCSARARASCGSRAKVAPAWWRAGASKHSRSRRTAPCSPMADSRAMRSWCNDSSRRGRIASRSVRPAPDAAMRCSWPRPRARG